jgi:inorganic pyrophosphatase
MYLCAMYKEILNKLKVAESINVISNFQVWRNNATQLRKETGRVFHIREVKDQCLIIRIL